MQPSNTDFGSTVADERSELSMNEENNDDSTKLNSQDNSIGAEQIENGESQNQSSQDVSDKNKHGDNYLIIHHFLIFIL